MKKFWNCAILVQQNDEQWVQNWLEQVDYTKLHVELVKFNVSQKMLEMAHSEPEQPLELHERFFNFINQDGVVEHENLIKLAVYLLHYDMVLLPVSSQNLVWTRLLLQQMKNLKFETTPMFGISNGVEPIALYDLIRLGLYGYVKEQATSDELRVGIMCAHKHYRKAVFTFDTETYTELKEKNRQKALMDLQNSATGLNALASLGSEGHFLDQPFNVAKSIVIEFFEKSYIHYVLKKNNGNISKAARAAKKNRRVFWELINKYKIDASEFK